MKRLASVTLALTLAIAANAQAGAGDDARVLTEQINGISNTGPNNVAARTVGCDFGERALGGGIRALPVQTTTPVSYSSPFASSQQGAPFTGLVPNQWRSRARNLGTQTRNFIAFAVCSASSDATLVSIDTSATPSNEGAGLFESISVALCPGGQRAVGGGAFVDEFGAPATNLQQSGPVDETGQPANTVSGDIARGWQASALTTANGAGLRVYALCSAASLATVQVVSKELAASTNGFDTAQCPTGTRALSGGVTTSGNPSSSITVIAPASSAGGPLSVGPPQVAQGWFTNVFNGATTRTYNFSAVCEGPAPTPPTPPADPPNPADPTVPSNAFTIGELSRNRDRGTGSLAVTVPGPGTVSLTSTRLKPQTVAAAAAGTVAVPVKAAADRRRKLRRTGKLKASAAITFAPTGGTPATQTTRVKLLRD